MRSGQVSRLHRSAEKNVTSDRQRTKIKSAKQGDQKEKYRPTIRKQKKRCSFPFSAAFYRWQLLCPPPHRQNLRCHSERRPPFCYAFVLIMIMYQTSYRQRLFWGPASGFLLLFLSFPRYCLSARKIKLHLSSFPKALFLREKSFFCLIHSSPYTRIFPAPFFRRQPLCPLIPALSRILPRTDKKLPLARQANILSAASHRQAPKSPYCYPANRRQRASPRSDKEINVFPNLLRKPGKPNKPTKKTKARKTLKPFPL